MRDPYIEAMREDAQDDALVAAADITNGAMVALVPSQPDLERLALEGGEPLDQLHLTLLYLGEADAIDAETRAALIDAGRDMVQGWDSVEAEAFAPAVFNPTGPEPCAVMICSGAELAEFYETAIADVTELIDLPPDMHLPWIPHVSVLYFASAVDGHLITQDGTASTDLAALFDRTGPLTFDRLRFAFGGEVTDIPITSKIEAAPGTPVTETTPMPVAVAAEEAQTAAATGPIREVWDGPLH